MLSYSINVRIIARKTIREFIESQKGNKDYQALKAGLEAWFHEVQKAEWKNPLDVTRSYATASLVGQDRAVFNIKGNSYRLVVAINYKHSIVFIKWVGSHAEYDKIDVRKVEYEH